MRLGVGFGGSGVRARRLGFGLGLGLGFDVALHHLVVFLARGFGDLARGDLLLGRVPLEDEDADGRSEHERGRVQAGAQLLRLRVPKETGRLLGASGMVRRLHSRVAQTGGSRASCGTSKAALPTLPLTLATSNTLLCLVGHRLGGLGPRASLAHLLRLEQLLAQLAREVRGVGRLVGEALARHLPQHRGARLELHEVDLVYGGTHSSDARGRPCRASGTRAGRRRGAGGVGGVGWGGWGGGPPCSAPPCTARAAAARACACAARARARRARGRCRCSPWGGRP